MWCVLVLTAAVAAGCGAKAKSANAPAIPPLAVPEPPPRVLPPLHETAVVAPVLPEGPITASAGTPEVPVPAGRTPATQTRRETAAPVAADATAQTPLEPSRDLRPGRAAEEAAEVAKIERLLETAKSHLASILEPSRLSEGNREQYEDARQYIEIAQKAMKERRLSYALANAEKAMTIAVQLPPK